MPSKRIKSKHTTSSVFTHAYKVHKELVWRLEHTITCDKDRPTVPLECASCITVLETGRWILVMSCTTVNVLGFACLLAVCYILQQKDTWNLEHTVTCDGDKPTIISDWYYWFHATTCHHILAGKLQGIQEMRMSKVMSWQAVLPCTWLCQPR